MQNFTKVEDLEPNGYALELLLNGNISTCIEYISFMYSINLIKSAFIELALIKENCPEKFDYIMSKIRTSKRDAEIQKMTIEY